MSTGKYPLWILGLTSCAALLIAQCQPAARLKGPVASAANLEKPSLEKPAGTPGTMSLPVTLEENLGQAPARAEFVGRGAGLTVLLTHDGIELAVSARHDEKGTARTVKLHVTELSRHGRAPKSTRGKFRWRGRQRLRGETNYLLGRDARRWHTHVAHFESAEAEGVLPGVSVSVYGNDRGIEYDLRLAGGTDTDRIRLDVSGADALRLDSTGNLVMVAGDRAIQMRSPAIYEELPTDAGRQNTQAVNGGYVLEGDGSVGFRVGSHRKDATLVLDPSLSLTYSTFLGGAGEDSANSIALDSSGKVYVGGTTTSATTFSEAGATSTGPGEWDRFLYRQDGSSRERRKFSRVSDIPWRKRRRSWRTNRGGCNRKCWNHGDHDLR